MLWTDGIFISVDDLARVDSEIEKVAEDENITLDGTNGVLRGAIEEAGQELCKMMVAFGGYLSAGDVSPNHLAAVLNIGLGNAVRSRALLNQMVVSGSRPDEWTNTKRWAVHYTLQYFYRDAFNRTVKDRYEGKMRYYKSELDRKITKSLPTLGLPVIIQPLSRPAAFFDRSPLDYLGSIVNQYGNSSWGSTGRWSSSNLSSVAPVSGTPAGGLFDVVVSYVCQGQPNAGGSYLADATKYISSVRNGNAESNPSEIADITVSAGEVLSVSIASLNPPNGVQDPSTRIICAILPLAATGWNVYAGPKGSVLTLQNASPISIFTETYDLVSDPTTTGVEVGGGQYADRKMSLTPMRQRA